MTQQSNAPPIRSRADRAKDRESANDSPPSNGTSPEEADEKDAALDNIRELARSMGYDVRKEPRPRRPRPEPRDGRISMTCRLHPDVRDAMERGRLELNMNFSDMVNAGVVMFLRSQNLGVGVDPDQFLPG